MPTQIVHPIMHKLRCLSTKACALMLKVCIVKMHELKQIYFLILLVWCIHCISINTYQHFKNIPYPGVSMDSTHNQCNEVLLRRTSQFSSKQKKFLPTKHTRLGAPHEGWRIYVILEGIGEQKCIDQSKVINLFWGLLQRPTLLLLHSNVNLKQVFGCGLKGQKHYFLHTNDLQSNQKSRKLSWFFEFLCGHCVPLLSFTKEVLWTNLY